MRRILLLLIVAVASTFTGVCQGTQIQAGSVVYIEPTEGFETFLASAFAKKKVPLAVVLDSSKAQFVIKSTFSTRDPSSPGIVINNSNGGSAGSGFPILHGNYGRTDASISVVDIKSSQIVFAYSVGKSANTNQLQSAAEACAKHLKEYIEKQQKAH